MNKIKSELIKYWNAFVLLLKRWFEYIIKLNYKNILNKVIIAFKKFAYTLRTANYKKAFVEISVLFNKVIKRLLQLLNRYFNKSKRNDYYKAITSFAKKKYKKLRVFIVTLTWKKARQYAIKGFVLFLVLSILFVFGLILAVRGGIFGHVPSTDELSNINNHEASLVYSADKELIGKYYAENRSVVKLDEIPPYVIDALISTEDVRFLEHDGVDLRSLLRVLVKSILLGQDNSGGGSTISQQLIKNLYGRKGYRFLSMPITKIREMVIASRLEEVYSKQEILALYLNTVSFGENVFGIENASMRYFSKNCKDLTIEESAVLVGMLKANTYYNPHINPKHSFERRNTVLALMKKNNTLGNYSFDSLTSLPLKLKYKSALEYEQENGYFLAYVKSEAEKIVEKYNEENGTNYDLLTDGLKIETTLEKRMQNIMLDANKTHLMKLQRELNAQLKNTNFWKKNKNLIEEYEAKHGILGIEKKATLVPFGMEDSVMSLSSLDSLKYYLSALQSAILASDPESGAVKVWIGGSNFQFFPYNRVLAKRQVGSTFKPIVYYTAMEKGLQPCKFFKNEKKVYEEYENWSPGNGTDEYEGYYSVRGALANSVNTVAAQVLFEAGIDESIETARKLGIKSDIPKVPSIVLGVADISLYEMVQAYSTFANGGYASYLYTIRKITAKDGTILYEKKERKRSKVLRSRINEQLVQMLSDVVNEGTARRLRQVYHLNQEIAGKTGTTQKNTDGWFIGFTPNIVMGVWVGVDNPTVHFQNTVTGQGANTALPIWALGFEQMMRYRWGKQYAGTFDLDLSFRMDCEMWAMEEPGFLNRFFNRDQRNDNDSIGDDYNLNGEHAVGNAAGNKSGYSSRSKPTISKPMKSPGRKDNLGDVVKSFIGKKKKQKRN